MLISFIIILLSDGSVLTASYYNRGLKCFAHPTGHLSITEKYDLKSKAFPDAGISNALK